MADTYSTMMVIAESIRAAGFSDAEVVGRYDGDEPYVSVPTGVDRVAVEWLQREHAEQAELDAQLAQWEGF